MDGQKATYYDISFIHSGTVFAEYTKVMKFLTKKRKLNFLFLAKNHASVVLSIDKSLLSFNLWPQKNFKNTIDLDPGLFFTFVNILKVDKSYI